MLTVCACVCTYVVVMCVCVCVCHLIEVVRDFPRSGKGRLVRCDEVEHHPQSLEPSHVAAGTQCTEGRRQQEHTHQLSRCRLPGRAQLISHHRTYVRTYMLKASKLIACTGDQSGCLDI